MSVLEGSNEVQIFNNAAFDSGGCVKDSCFSTSIESDSSKENHNPLMNESPCLSVFKTPVGTTAFSGKIGVKKGLKDATLRNEAVIDSEIKEIEMEMSRLSLKLEALKLEKAEIRKVRIRERRCSIVPAKYMEFNSKNSANSKTGSQRRGMSLCPAEIYSAEKSRQAMIKPDVSSSNVNQNRRQSCFWKLGEIDELKNTKARGGIGTGIGKSASVSPKPPPRSAVPKFDASKKAVTTIGSKKMSPKNNALLSSVQPKKLFKESEKSSSSASASAILKKSIKSGRVIPSRYCQNQAQTQTPDSAVPIPKTQSLRESESRVKKRWEIPAKGNVVVYMSNDGEDSRSNSTDSRSTVGIDDVSDVLRKIKTVRCVNESPRDSGAVKRVADLVGKKSFFADSGQALSFVDEETDADDDHENNA